MFKKLFSPFLKTKNTKRILFCLDQIIMGGLERVLCQYLLALKDYPGLIVSVASKKKITDPYFLNFFKTNNIELTDNFWELDRHKKILFFFKLGQKKRVKIQILLNFFKWRFLQKNNDIFIDFANFSFLEEFSGLKKPKFAWCHGSILFFQDYCKGKEILNNYDKIVCLSESFRSDLISSDPQFADKIICIYNPIDDTKVKNLATQESVIVPDAPYFVALQRLDNSDKDVGTIIKGFDIYSQSDKETKLYILGDGPDRENLEQEARDNKNVIFTGQIYNPCPLIKNAQGLILSSTKKVGEGLPNSLLEAHALGTLAISSDVKSGVREILLNGEAGLLFEAENPKSLAEVLIYRKEHPDECVKKVETATHHLDRFSIETAIQKVVRLCEVDN